MAQAEPLQTASARPASRRRHVEVQRFPSNRRLVVAALRAGRHKTPMYGFLDVDVTLARRLLAAADPPSSMTAFLAASVARAAAAHPEVHAYRDWRGRLVTHQFVDVATMVEIATEQGPFAIPHTLHDADTRSVPDLSGELHRVKTEPWAAFSARWAKRYAPWATRIPGAIPAVYAVMARSTASRRQIGTGAVTSIGMFGGGAGYGLTPLTLMSLELIVGGISQQPRVIDGHIEVREVLNLTLAIDHDVVDGAPSARFA
jgi:pyruvate/2-oxoglutarate dehydrogenase complex dihydrolipoamide acyltransferase (E2) component